MFNKLTTTGKALIALLIIGLLICGKFFIFDRLPQEVQESQHFGKVSLPDSPEASLTGNAAIKLEFPKETDANNGGTKIIWKMMAWQSQNGIVYSNGGSTTKENSLFDKAKLDVTLERQDDCFKSCADLVAFTKQYKEKPETPAVFITFMGSGIPAYISGISKQVEDLGPEYQPVAFLTTGKSYGEDQIIGDKKYKDNKQNLKGATVVGVRMDGDLDLALKLCGDNGIKVNVDDKVYDPEALNFMYSSDFIDAVTKYNSKYEETRKIAINGKTIGRDTTISADLVATWTPGDVKAKQGRGGVTIISTKQYASIMPNITITCKKWLNDHRTQAQEITKACAIAGDQIRTFDDVKKYACRLNADIYKEETPEYWYKYYNGEQIDEDTRLGGSMVFNLGDMANMLGIFIEGQTDHTDIYKSVYNTFGTLQSKYYPNDLPKYLEYTKAFDKTVLQTVINENPELLTGKINLIDYSKTEKGDQIGNKSYNIEFASGSSELTESGKRELDEIYTNIVSADGTKVELIGHTDNQGNSSENLSLSERRAKSALEYLKQKGVESQRLISKGRGDSEPVADNSTSAGRAKNRRVNISLFAIKE
jgi:outer membrane protein OmpA-like peptidoglycan-associated protein